MAASAPMPPGVTGSPFAANNADQSLFVAAARGLRLMGWSCRESAGTPAAFSFRIFNGSSSSGTTLANLGGAASANDNQWLGPNGINADNGLSIKHGAGVYDVTVYWVLVPDL